MGSRTDVCPRTSLRPNRWAKPAHTSSFLFFRLSSRFRSLLHLIVFFFVFSLKKKSEAARTCSLVAVGTADPKVHFAAYPLCHKYEFCHYSFVATNMFLSCLSRQKTYLLRQNVFVATKTFVVTKIYLSR